MLKKASLLFFSVSLFASENKQSERETFTTKNILIAGGVMTAAGVAIILYAPVVLPAAMITSAKVGAAAATAKVTAAASTAASAVVIGLTVVETVKPVVEQIPTAIALGQIAQKEFFPTDEQKKEAILQRRESNLSKAKKDFNDCLITNKARIKVNAPKVPSACEELSGMIALSAGYAEVKRILEESIK
jgi:hypothetical protein